MKSVRGDLLALAQRGDFDVIVHGCNCFCAFGSGVAGQIKRRFPEAYAADCRTTKGDRGKLGRLSSAEVVGDGEHRFTVVNAYTQYRGGRSTTPLVDVDAVGRAMRAVREAYAGKRIGLPRIGAGAAGGDWAVLSKVIDDALAGEDVTVVEYAPA